MPPTTNWRTRQATRRAATRQQRIVMLIRRTTRRAIFKANFKRLLSGGSQGVSASAQLSQRLIRELSLEMTQARPSDINFIEMLIKQSVVTFKKWHVVIIPHASWYEDAERPAIIVARLE